MSDALSSYYDSYLSRFILGVHERVDYARSCNALPAENGYEYWAVINDLLYPWVKTFDVINVDREYSLSVQNAYATSKTYTVSRSGFDGISDSIGNSVTLSPLERRQYTISISLEGEKNFSGTLTFTNSNTNASYSHSVSGTRGAYLRPYVESFLAACTSKGSYVPILEQVTLDALRAHPNLYHENIHLSLYNVNISTIVSTYTYSFILYNSYNHEVTYTIERDGYEGILDSLGTTITVAAETRITVTVIVSMSGDFNVNATLSFTLSEYGQVAYHTITGIRGNVQSVRPLSGLSETWEWSTEVITNLDYSEICLPLRHVPRMSLECSYHVRYETEAIYLERLIYEVFSSSFKLPRFEMQVTAVVQAGSGEIYCDTSYGGWAEGDAGLVWKNYREYEIFEVAGVYDDRLVAANQFSQDYGDCLIMPCSTVNFSGNPTRTDTGGEYSTFKIAYYVDESPMWDIPEASETLEDIEVFNMRLEVAHGDVQRTFDVPMVILDNGLSKPVYLNVRSVATQQYQVTISCNTLEEITTMREFLLRRQGMVRPFWASTQRNDIEVVSDVMRGTEYLTVTGGDIGQETLATNSPRTVLCIELVTGEILYRYIRSYTKIDASTDQIRCTQYIHDQDLTPSDFKRISFMSQYKLGADSVSWTWEKTYKASVSFMVKEVFGA